MKSAFLMFALIIAFTSGIPAAHAQWPQRPVKLVIPFPPGGVTDAIARITADWLSPRLGHTVVPENKPGASGTIAADFVARAAPDGYTLFMAASPQLAIVPHMQSVTYDPVGGFAPIAIVGSNPFVLGANDRIPARTLKEFVEYVRLRPGELNFASPGNGTVGHLSMVLFLARAGLSMEDVQYKGGGPAVADFIAGHVAAYFGNVIELMPHRNRVKLLAVSGERRAPQLPDVPTVAEQGYPGFRTATWNGLTAPARTPEAIVERLAREIAAGCKDAGFVARLDKIGVVATCSTPSEFARTIRQDLAQWGEAVQAVNLARTR